MPSDVPSFIKRVMPGASAAELQDATATFDEYMAVVWQIFQRIKREKIERDSLDSKIQARVEDISNDV